MRRSEDVTGQHSRMGTRNRASGANTAVESRGVELCRFAAARTHRITSRALGRGQPATIVAYHSIDVRPAPFTISPENLQKQLSLIPDKYETQHLMEVVDLLSACEAFESKRELERIIGRSVTAFSYPYGSLDDFSAQTGRVLQAGGGATPP